MTASRHIADKPEINPLLLLLSSIHSAIDDLFRGPEPERRAAFTWLYIAESQEPMTFLWCCEGLGLDPVGVREWAYRRRPALIHRMQLSHATDPAAGRGDRGLLHAPGRSPALRRGKVAASTDSFMGQGRP